MEFRLLGPLSVESGGTDLTPARPKRRALLALLLLQQGEIVPTDVLVDRLWGEDPPPSATSALHGHVSALRRLVGERLETRSPGYRLRLAPGDLLDIARFEELVNQAGGLAAPERAERLRAALALFRGEPLADLYDAGGQADQARLEELRLAALEQRIDADLELGRHAELIPELDRLVREQPLRERLRGQLMLALYRAGRQADALSVGAAGRRLLSIELGVEPGPAIDRLERRILEHDIGLVEDRAPAPLALPATGIVTVLAADLAERRTRPEEREHSSRRGEVEPLLDALRTIVARSRGSLIAADPLTAVFRRSTDAAEAALSMQRHTRGLDLAPRIGIHSTDLGAPAGLEARARGAHHLRRAARAGQTLVSDTTRRILADTGRADLELVDLGEHRLADLDAPRHVHQLDDPAHPSRFPQLLVGEERLQVLPAQSTSLIGRDREIPEVVSLLTEGDARLVTLTGAGGIGKTRLAMHVAAELTDRLEGGVRLVELAALADANLVAWSIGRALELPDAVSSDGAAAIGRAAGDRELLLILDTFEHLRPASAVVAELAAHAGRMRMLVTSRAPLHVKGEVVYPVRPLATPAEDADTPAAADSDAVDLFIDRALAVRPALALGSGEIAAIGRLCSALDGLPLAIELAATRIAVLPPKAMGDRLDRTLEIASASLRAGVGRHGSLRATIAWSHELLSEPEGRLFERLSVFPGGANLEAIEAVCSEGEDVVEPLAALVDLSLVRADPGPTGPRFVMLDTVRAFAAEQLVDADPERLIATRHAEHLVAVAERAEPQLRGTPWRWLDQLEREIDNLRAALDHLSASGEHQRQLALAGALWRFWYLRGYLTEGRNRLEQALADDGPARRTPARARALIGAAVMAGNTGDHLTAEARAEEGLALHRSLGDPWGAAYCAFMLGNAVVDRNAQRAIGLFEDSIATFRELGDEHSALLATRSLANAREHAGDRAVAVDLLRDALRRARETDNPRLEASFLGLLGSHAFDEGRLTDAAALLAESLRIHAQQGDLLDSAADLARAARVVAMLGRPQVAVRLLASLASMHFEIGGRGAVVAMHRGETIARVRRQIDGDLFEAEWAAGSRLPIADALRLGATALAGDAASTARTR